VTARAEECKVQMLRMARGTEPGMSSGDWRNPNSKDPDSTNRIALKPVEAGCEALFARLYVV